MDVTLTTPRSQPCVAEVGGRLFVIGGVAGGQPTTAHEGFDPRSQSCRSCAPLPSGLAARSAVGWRGRLIVLVAGATGPALIAYDPDRDAWSDLPSPPADIASLFTWSEDLGAFGLNPGALYRLD
jgi:hypothetical protein